MVYEIREGGSAAGQRYYLYPAESEYRRLAGSWPTIERIREDAAAGTLGDRLVTGSERQYRGRLCGTVEAELVSA